MWKGIINKKINKRAKTKLRWKNKNKFIVRIRKNKEWLQQKKNIETDRKRIITNVIK